MSIVAPAFFLLMLSLLIFTQQFLLLRQLSFLFALDHRCASQLEAYEEVAASKCLPPRSDHAFWQGESERAAGAICWFVHPGVLPQEFRFYPNLSHPQKAYRCDLP